MGAAMSTLFGRILKNIDGFTAIEYSLLAAFTLVLAGQLFSRF